MANLIVCCDGTWNTADQRDKGLPAPTNVAKLRNLVAATDENGVEQKVYYHPGVGTDPSLLDKVVGGGLGKGLSNNVKSAYAWLARVYREGDRIFLFGFSRGAYTVRSLGGMMARVGLLNLSNPGLSPTEFWDRVDRAHDLYREQDSRSFPSSWTTHPSPSQSKAPPLHFIGVWDTVGALGIPDELSLDVLDREELFTFNDTTLGPNVAHARHALAMDERRLSFTPTLWTQIPPASTVKQQWFPGVHSDVGGGYAESALSDNALEWMLKEAHDAGLNFRSIPGGQMAPSPQGPLHDSYTGAMALLRERPRAVPKVVAGSTAMHTSATDRQASPPLSEAAYWPTHDFAASPGGEVEIFARQRWNRTAFYLEAGTTYKFEATGEWQTQEQPYSPAGVSAEREVLLDLTHLASNLLGKVETVAKTLTGNDLMNIRRTKRVEKAPLMMLIGEIAGGDGVNQNTKRTKPYETLLIGTGDTITPETSGYLHCYANDSWETYDNNAGSVHLTVTRV